MFTLTTRTEEIPGVVVHLVHSGDVIQSDGAPVCSGGRQKKRVGLVEYGKPFMDLKTPLEALKVIYYLLESEFEFDMLSSFQSFLGEQLRNSCISGATFYIEVSAAETYCIWRKIALLPRH